LPGEVFVEPGNLESGSSGASDIREPEGDAEEGMASSIPSSKLEQQAQRFGFRESKFPIALIASPQQTQIRGSI
jgi:hypothetical protein